MLIMTHQLNLLQKFGKTPNQQSACLFQPKQHKARPLKKIKPVFMSYDNVCECHVATQCVMHNMCVRSDDVRFKIASSDL